MSKLQATSVKVQIKWFVYSGDQKIASNASMRGTWAYDAQCSCGWESKTGGGIRYRVADMVKDHKKFDHDYIQVYS